jgi:hypothetical protein
MPPKGFLPSFAAESTTQNAADSAFLIQTLPESDSSDLYI